MLARLELRLHAWDLCRRHTGRSAWLASTRDRARVPRDPGNLDQLIEALRSAHRVTDVNVVIGMRGPLAPPEMCNGLQVPIVGFDQIYSFDVDSLIKSIPRPEKISVEDFTPATEVTEELPFLEGFC